MDNTNNEKFYKNKWLMVALAVVVIITGFILFRNKGTSTVEKDDADVVRAGEVSVVGSFACLPYKKSVTNTACVLGVKGDDDNIYSIDTTALQGGDTDIQPEDKIRIVGTFEPVSTTSEESKIFDIYGVLKARLLKKA